MEGSGGVYLAVCDDKKEELKATGKHVYFHTTDGNVCEVAGTLKVLEAMRFPHLEFMPGHYCIVNMLPVEELSSAGFRSLRGENLSVSRLSYPQLQKDYMVPLFERRGAAGS